MFDLPNDVSDFILTILIKSIGDYYLITDICRDVFSLALVNKSNYNYIEKNQSKILDRCKHLQYQQQTVATLKKLIKNLGISTSTQNKQSLLTSINRFCARKESKALFDNSLKLCFFVEKCLVIHENKCLNTYGLLEDDLFQYRNSKKRNDLLLVDIKKMSAEFYPDFKDMNRLKIQRIKTKNDNIKTRKKNLIYALDARKIEFRKDSELCQRYIRYGDENLEYIVDTMEEMRFLHKYTDYGTIFGSIVSNIYSYSDSYDRNIVTFQAKELAIRSWLKKHSFSHPTLPQSIKRIIPDNAQEFKLPDSYKTKHMSKSVCKRVYYYDYSSDDSSDDYELFNH